MAIYIFQLRRGTKDDASSRDDWKIYEGKPDHMKPLQGELVLEYDNGIPRLKIGDGIHEFSELPYMSIDSFILPKQEYVSLSTTWNKTSDDRYYQEVEVTGVNITSKSKVDLQPTAEQLYIFHEKDLAFVAENKDGTVRVYCVGQVPKNEYNIPVTVTEVVTDEEVIVGNTTATPNPLPDWNQTDETKADYIKNKPVILTEDDISDLIKDQIQVDWNQTDTTAADYIKNKPEILTTDDVDDLIKDNIKDQIQVDWEQADESAVDYIKNKPILGTVASKDKIDKTDLVDNVQASLGKADVSTSVTVNGAAQVTFDADTKQDVIDDTLNTTTKTIPGAINEVYKGLNDISGEFVSKTYLNSLVEEWTFTLEDGSTITKKVLILPETTEA